MGLRVVGYKATSLVQLCLSAMGCKAMVRTVSEFKLLVLGLAWRLGLSVVGYRAVGDGSWVKGWCRSLSCWYWEWDWDGGWV